MREMFDHGGLWKVIKYFLGREFDIIDGLDSIFIREGVSLGLKVGESYSDSFMSVCLIGGF